MFDTYARYFQTEIPVVPGARYAHVLLVRRTDSYAVFRTDGSLNVARVRAGVQDHVPITRITLFKRKQSTAERLTGRELLRRHGVIGEECRYNEGFCGVCPDCVLYGYAIGDSGSEKSKVYVDTCYSVTAYDDSHETFTLNAPYEDGTMTRGSQTTNRFSEEDHVLPQVFFPAVVTLRDPTPAGLAYLLNNLRRTRLYGAETTRAGRMTNQVLGLIFADGEIFSNLRLTQRTHDLLTQAGQLTPPLDEQAVATAVTAAAAELVAADGVAYTAVRGDELTALLHDVDRITTDESKLAQFLHDLKAETAAYAERAGATGKDKGKKKG